MEQAIAQIGAEIGGPDVLAALQSVGEALQTAATQLEALSFGPPVDVVVGSIDQVDTLLKTVGATLPAPAALALKGALRALPDTLDPAFDALTGQLGDLLEAGPIPLLEQIEAAPAQLRAQLAAFDPAALSGQLGGVFDGVVEALRAGSPARLVEQLGGLTAGLADRLLQLVDTAALVAPLRGPARPAARRGRDPRPRGARAAPARRARRAAGRDPRAARRRARAGRAHRDRRPRRRRGRRACASCATCWRASARPSRPSRHWRRASRSGWTVSSRARSSTTAPSRPPSAALNTAVNRVRAAGLDAEAAQAGSGLVAALDALDPAGRLAALVAAHRTVPPLAALPASAGPRRGRGGAGAREPPRAGLRGGAAPRWPAWMTSCAHRWPTGSRAGTPSSTRPAGRSRTAPPWRPLRPRSWRRPAPRRRSTWARCSAASCWRAGGSRSASARCWSPWTRCSATSRPASPRWWPARPPCRCSPTRSAPRSPR